MHLQATAIQATARARVLTICATCSDCATSILFMLFEAFLMSIPAPTLNLHTLTLNLPLQ